MRGRGDSHVSSAALTPTEHHHDPHPISAYLMAVPGRCHLRKLQGQAKRSRCAPSPRGALQSPLRGSTLWSGGTGILTSSVCSGHGGSQSWHVDMGPDLECSSDILLALDPTSAPCSVVLKVSMYLAPLCCRSAWNRLFFPPYSCGCSPESLRSLPGTLGCVAGC